MAMKHPLLLALPCYALDQATKWLVVQNMEFETEHPVVQGFFSLVYWGNTGSAFGMFKHMSLGFVILSVVTLIGLLVAWARGSFHDRLNWWGVGLLMGGILGNVTDRLVHGYVVDFLLFNLHVPKADPWPAFNVADSCICIAVGLFLIASFREGRRDSGAKVAVGGP
jgi:signal peptidase II